MGVEATGEPSVSMRLGDDHADKQKQAKQFNKEIDQAKEAPDDDVPSAENAPQRKAVGGWPTTGSLFTIPQFTDEQIYGETDAALKRIDAQIAEDRAISKRPYEKRLQHARNRVSDGMDTWGTPKYNATKMTGDMVWNYGRNNTWKDDQGRELPFFTEGEKKAVYEDQNSKQQWAQQEQKEANERELTRVQIARDAQVKAGFDRIRSPAAVLQPFAFAAFGAPVFAAYAGIQTGKSVGDAYNACKDGPTTECLAATTHAGIAVATDDLRIKIRRAGQGSTSRLVRLGRDHQPKTAGWPAACARGAEGDRRPQCLRGGAQPGGHVEGARTGSVEDPRGRACERRARCRLPGGGFSEHPRKPAAQSTAAGSTAGTGVNGAPSATIASKTVLLAERKQISSRLTQVRANIKSDGDFVDAFDGRTPSSANGKRNLDAATER